MGQERENSKPEKLSPKFIKAFQEAMLKSRAQAMADAMIEENPNTDPKQAFQQALDLLTGEKKDPTDK